MTSTFSIVLGSILVLLAAASLIGFVLQQRATDATAIATDAIGSAEISAAAVTKIQAGLSTYAGGDTSGTTTLLSRLSSARAGYLDNLSAGVPTAAAITTAVWDALTSALTTVGSVGKRQHWRSSDVQG